MFVGNDKYDDNFTNLYLTLSSTDFAGSACELCLLPVSRKTRPLPTRALCRERIARESHELSLVFPGEAVPRAVLYELPTISCMDLFPLALVPLCTMVGFKIMLHHHVHTLHRVVITLFNQFGCCSTS